jgi:16S rRNA G527 N7-methylase RsmG
MTLIEAQRRRVSFLSAVIREIGLERVRVVAGRAEELAVELGGRFDAVVMRCAGEPARVLRPARALLDRGGVVILAGPPAPSRTHDGRWVEVPGVRPGSVRRFLVVRKS